MAPPSQPRRRQSPRRRPLRIVSHCFANRRIVLPGALCIALRCVALICHAPRCAALRYSASRCVAAM
eukprot:1803061-Pyramimonas_sp.AAC.1